MKRYRYIIVGQQNYPGANSHMILAKIDTQYKYS